jgi:hypothetical protein
MLKDFLLGLHGLHSCGIAHGDPHPKNLLADLLPMVDVEDETTYERTGKLLTGSAKRPVGREDRLSDDQWAPDYLYHSEPLSAVRGMREAPSTKLGDLGTGDFILDICRFVIIAPSHDIHADERLFQRSTSTRHPRNRQWRGHSGHLK